MAQGPTQTELLGHILDANQRQVRRLDGVQSNLSDLHKLIRHIDDRRPRRSSWDIATSIGYALGFLGTLSAAGIAYFGSNVQTGSQSKTEMCKLAIESLNDESPNPLLSQVQRRELVDLQAKLAQKCLEDSSK